MRERELTIPIIATAICFSVKEITGDSPINPARPASIRCEGDGPIYVLHQVQAAVKRIQEKSGADWQPNTINSRVKLYSVEQTRDIFQELESSINEDTPLARRLRRVPLDEEILGRALSQLTLENPLSQSV